MSSSITCMSGLRVRDLLSIVGDSTNPQCLLKIKYFRQEATVRCCVINRKLKRMVFSSYITPHLEENKTADLEHLTADEVYKICSKHAMEWQDYDLYAVVIAAVTIKQIKISECKTQIILGVQ